MSTDKRDSKQPREVDVLKRMLNTPPAPHIAKPKAKKPAKTPAK